MNEWIFHSVFKFCCNLDAFNLESQICYFVISFVNVNFNQYLEVETAQSPAVTWLSSIHSVQNLYVYETNQILFPINGF